MRIHGNAVRVRQAVLDARKHRWALRLRPGDWAELYGRRDRQEIHIEIEIRTACYHPSLDELLRCDAPPATGVDIEDTRLAEQFGPTVAALLPDPNVPYSGGWIALTYTVVEPQGSSLMRTPAGDARPRELAAATSGTASSVELVGLLRLAGMRPGSARRISGRSLGLVRHRAMETM